MTTCYLIVCKMRLIKRPFKCNNLHRFKIILWTISAYLARSGIRTTPTGSCHHHKQVHRHRGIFCRQKRPHIKQRNVGWHLFTRFGLLWKENSICHFTRETNNKTYLLQYDDKECIFYIDKWKLTFYHCWGTSRIRRTSCSRGLSCKTKHNKLMTEQFYIILEGSLLYLYI